MKVAHKAPMPDHPAPAPVLVDLPPVDLLADLLVAVLSLQPSPDDSKARKSVPPALAIKRHP
jgi:hypothetical protein